MIHPPAILRNARKSISYAMRKTAYEKHYRKLQKVIQQVDVITLTHSPMTSWHGHAFWNTGILVIGILRSPMVPLTKCHMEFCCYKPNTHWIKQLSCWWFDSQYIVYSITYIHAFIWFCFIVVTVEILVDSCAISIHGPLAKNVKFSIAHAPGMAPLVSAPDMHHGTCVTY